MSEDDILCTGRLHHLGRHFAGECAFFLVGAVLGSESDDVLVEELCDAGQMDERRADDDVAVGLFSSQCFVELFGERNTFLQVHVHFPVACYNLFSHFFVLLFNKLI